MFIGLVAISRKNPPVKFLANNKIKSGKSLWSTSGGPKKKETLNHNHAATADEKKTVDESPLSKTWLKLYLSLPYAYPASKILQMITVHLDLEQDRERQDCRLRKLLQLLRRLTGLAMMAADDTYTGVEVVAELSGATTPTNGFQARARSHFSRPPVKGGGAGGSAAYRAPTPPPLTMIGTRTETWSLDFNGGLVAKGAKFQWKIQLDHFAAPFVTHCQVRKSEAQVGP